MDNAMHDNEDNDSFCRIQTCQLPGNLHHLIMFKLQQLENVNVLAKIRAKAD